MSNADDAHANDADTANDANANADDANDANPSKTDAADKADDDPFPVLTCEERRRFPDIQRIIIRTLISRGSGPSVPSIFFFWRAPFSFFLFWRESLESRTPKNRQTEQREEQREALFLPR